MSGRWLGRLVAGLLAVSSGLVHGAITAVTPSEGALGAVLTITGTAFGEKKPKAYLEPSAGGKRIALKVTAVTGTQITAAVSKGVVGTYAVIVVPSGLAEERFDGGFSLRAPVVHALEPATATPGGSFVVHGWFFGVKPTVLVGTVRAKVTAASDTALTVLVPTKLANGIYTISVISKLGSGSLPASFTLTGSAVGVPTKDYFRADFGGETMEVSAGPLLGGSWAGVTNMMALQAADPPARLGGKARVFNITASVDLEGILPTLIDENPANPNEGLMVYQVTTLPDHVGGIPTGNTWLSRDVWEWTVTINAFVGGRVVGTFSGTLRDGATDAPLAVSGEFAVTVRLAK